MSNHTPEPHASYELPHLGSEGDTVTIVIRHKDLSDALRGSISARKRIEHAYKHESNVPARSMDRRSTWASFRSLLQQQITDEKSLHAHAEAARKNAGNSHG